MLTGTLQVYHGSASHRHLYLEPPNLGEGMFEGPCRCKVIWGRLTTTWTSDVQATEQHLDSFWLFVRVNNLHKVFKSKDQTNGHVLLFLEMFNLNQKHGKLLLKALLYAGEHCGYQSRKMADFFPG